MGIFKDWVKSRRKNKKPSYEFDAWLEKEKGFEQRIMKKVKDLEELLKRKHKSGDNRPDFDDSDYDFDDLTKLSADKNSDNLDMDVTDATDVELDDWGDNHSDGEFHRDNSDDDMSNVDFHFGHDDDDDDELDNNNLESEPKDEDEENEDEDDDSVGKDDEDDDDDDDDSNNDDSNGGSQWEKVEVE